MKRVLAQPKRMLQLVLADGYSVMVAVRSGRSSFRRTVRAVSGEAVPPGLLGICYGLDPVKKDKDNGIRALVILEKGQLGAGYVTHELAHAAYRVCEARGLKIDHWNRGGESLAVRHKSPEEVYCMTVESLTRQFWALYYKKSRQTGRTPQLKVVR